MSLFFVKKYPKFYWDIQYLQKINKSKNKSKSKSKNKDKNKSNNKNNVNENENEKTKYNDYKDVVFLYELHSMLNDLNKVLTDE